MQVPLKLQFKDVDQTPDLERRIRSKVDRLERHCDYLISCRVLVERPHRHEQSGNPYRVRIEASVPPGHDIVVAKDPGDNDLSDSLVTVINNAFTAAERQIKELVERQRREVKTHDVPRALVVRINRKQGFGFVRTVDGRELYFHRNAFLNGEFDHLEVGTEVRFEEEMGEDGPQATTVHVLGKPGARAATAFEPQAAEPPRGWKD